MGSPLYKVKNKNYFFRNTKQLKENRGSRYNRSLDYAKKKFNLDNKLLIINF